MVDQPSSADIRQFLFDFFSDEELRVLSFDYFPEVHDNLATSISKTDKILVLVGYCLRREIIPNLLAAIQKARPKPYEERFPQAPKGEARPEPAKPVHDPKQVFICHAHADAEFAHRLAHDLGNNGWRVWIAPDSILPGEMWGEGIDRGLDESGVMVLVLTPHSVRSSWVRKETYVAIQLECQGHIKFIPLEAEPCDVPYTWNTYQRISFQGDYGHGLEALLDTLEPARRERREREAQEQATRALPVVSTKGARAVNPYQFGGPVEGNRFYGRHDLVEAVINTLTTTRQNALVLQGQRRIGKTSLLHRLRDDPILCQGHIPIFFSLQLASGWSPARVLAALAKTVAQQLSLGTSVSDEVSLARDECEFQRVFLPQIYPHLKNKRLLFLLDEFDAVLPTGATDLPSYFLDLIEEEKEHTAFIFVIGQRLELLVDKGLLCLFQGAWSQQVGRFGEEDTHKLLTELGEQGNIGYSKEALAEIWALTNGHPYITQAISSEIFERLRRQKAQRASLDDVENCLDNVMGHAGGGLSWFWDGFSTKEQLVLAAVAELSDRNQGVGDARVDEALRDHRLPLAPIARRKAYQQLVAGEFLLDTGNGQYQFCVEFIRRWIMKYHRLVP